MQNALRRPVPDVVFDEAASWLWRGNSLGKALAPHLTPARYDAWVLAPPSVPDEHLSRILAGTMQWGPCSTLEQSLAFIAQAMRELDATWVVPDSMLLAKDLERAPRPWPYWGSEGLVGDEDLFYVVREPVEDAIKSALDDAGAASGEMGVLTTAAVPRDRATQADIASIAEASPVVAFSAYDSPARHIFLTSRDANLQLP